LKIVVLSPHRGDAAFSVGLAVSSWLAAGDTVEVLNCFSRSEYAPYSDAGSVHANDRLSFVTAVRSREDEFWRKLCGNKLTLSDLRLKDAPIRFHCSLDEIEGLAIRPEEKTFPKIRSAIAARRAALVLPLGIGAHVDHLTAREAALSAIDDSTAVAFYEELPDAASASPAATEVIAQELSARLKLDLLPVFAGEEADAEIAAARKRRYALCYDSQIDDDIVNRIAEHCTHYGGRERLWANAAWRGLWPTARYKPIVAIEVPPLQNSYETAMKQ
jgi:LmbE family N-acetylglucosaminyl deacetylase